MDSKNRIILVLSGIIMILLFFVKLKTCGSDNIISGRIDTITSRSIYTDTLRIYHDTTIYKPKPYTVNKWIPIPGDTVYLERLDSVRLYKKTFNDKYICISVVDSIHGELLSNSLKYTLKIPKDCVVVTNNITQHDTLIKIKSPKFGLWGGLEIGGNKTKFNNLTPYLTINIKNKQIGYGYNVLENTHNIRVGILLYKSKK